MSCLALRHCTYNYQIPHQDICDTMLKHYHPQRAAAFRPDIDVYRDEHPFNRALASALFHGMDFAGRTTRSGGGFSVKKAEIRVGLLMCGPGKEIGIVSSAYDQAAAGINAAPRLKLILNDLRRDAVECAGRVASETTGDAEIICQKVERLWSEICGGVFPLQLQAAVAFEYTRCMDFGYKDGLDAAMIRFGVYDIPRIQAQSAISSIHETLNQGGRLVIGDPVACSAEEQASLERIHRIRQEAAGRDIGECHIPTIHERAAQMRNAGFGPVGVPYIGESHMPMGDWNGQFGPDADNERIIARLRETVVHEARENPGFAKQASVRIWKDENGIMEVGLIQKVAVFTGVRRKP